MGAKANLRKSMLNVVARRRGWYQSGSDIGEGMKRQIARERAVRQGLKPASLTDKMRRLLRRSG